MKLTGETKRSMLISTINFSLGAITGIILFYATNKSPIEDNGFVVEFSKNAGYNEALKLWWLNMLWLFSIMIARCIAPINIAHPIVGVRGCLTSFNTSYILLKYSIKEAVSSIIPQCVSILPLMIYFSSRLNNTYKEDCSIKRSDAITICVLSAIASVIEVMLFRLLCGFLY